MLITFTMSRSIFFSTSNEDDNFSHSFSVPFNPIPGKIKKTQWGPRPGNLCPSYWCSYFVLQYYALPITWPINICVYLKNDIYSKKLKAEAQLMEKVLKMPKILSIIIIVVAGHWILVQYIHSSPLPRVHFLFYKHSSFSWYTPNMLGFTICITRVNQQQYLFILLPTFAAPNSVRSNITHEFSTNGLPNYLLKLL